jgi:hypothetical protein
MVQFSAGESRVVDPRSHHAIIRLLENSDTERNVSRPASAARNFSHVGKGPESQIDAQQLWAMNMQNPHFFRIIAALTINLPKVRVLGHYLNLEPETKWIRVLRSRAASEHVERKTPAPRPRGASRLAANQNARIADLYQEGWKPVDIAREVGTTEWTVHHRLNRLGVQRRPTGLTPEQGREAVRLYRNSESLRQIGLKFGFDAKTIKTAIVEAGVEIRPNPRHPRK